MKVKSLSASATATLTVRVPTKLRKRLEGLAKATDRNRSRLAVEALENYVDEQEEQLARIDRGIRDADAGRVVPHDDVKRYLKSWGSKHKLPPPSCE
jgi:predicted transcriptional regulator